MKLTFKEKAKLFWDRNKGMILGLVAMAGAATAIGAVGVHYSAKAEKEHQEEMNAQRAKWEEERKKALEEAEAEEEKIKNDPSNQLPCGGWVRPDNDNLYETDYPNLLANEVPLSAMGEFGKEMIRRLNEEYPDHENIGPFDPETAVADVSIDFGHQLHIEYQKWLAEQEQSQEKQTS